MNIPYLSLKIAFATTCSLVGAISCLGDTALAQTATPNLTEGSISQPKSEVDDNQIPQTLNPVDFIHNQNLRRSRNASEFSTDTEKKLDSAAAEFKRLQLQRLQEGQANEAPAAATPGN